MKAEYSVGACVDITYTDMYNMSPGELHSYVKENLSRELSREILKSNSGLEVEEDYNRRCRRYTIRLNVFSDEQLKMHDKDVVEEFCSRQ